MKPSMLDARLQTPVLTYRGRPIVDSIAICMFIDEAFPSDNKLLPDDAFLRARARNIIDYVCTNKFNPLIYRMLAHTDMREGIGQMMLATLRDMDAQMREVSQAGPYWFGAQFTLVDIAFFPFIDRCAVM